MPKKDYYDILGINKKASPEEIKKAYRTLAMKYHPDRNQGDKTAESKFKEASEAYQVLSDPKKKSSYDQFGHSAFEGGGGGAGGGGEQRQADAVACRFERAARTELTRAARGTDAQRGGANGKTVIIR